MRHPASFSDRRGFTLVEIIIVMLIIGISAGLITIAIGRGSSGLGLKTLTKDVSATLRFARNQAITQKKTYCFVINRNERAYRLYTDKIGDDNTKETVEVLNKPIPEDIEMGLMGSDEDEPFIEFFPVGNSTGGTVEVISSKGAFFHVIVNRITGKVDVEKGDG